MVAATVPVHRLTPDDVMRMVAAGVLDEDDRIELVEGVLVEMVPIGAAHDGAVAWLTRHFAHPDAPFEVRVQSTLLTAGGYLLPDLSLVEPLPRTALPTSALLVVEVAQTSQERDAEKAAEYAAAGVDEYWIVDLPGRAVTVHREPSGTTYARVERVADGTLAPSAAGASPVVVAELLG